MTAASADLAAQLLALQASVPQAMRERPQWLLWRAEQYEGDKKPRKVPYYVSGRKRNATQGSGPDREELASFELALQHLARGSYTGLGFAFLPGDQLIGVDIDGAIDDDGVVSERCQSIIEACGSYTELSPSGRGVHVICSVRANATEEECKAQTFKDNGIGLEVFCGRQFFTVTGRRWPGTPEHVAPLADGTLRRLQATVRAARRKPGRAAPKVGAVPAVAPATHAMRYCLAALESAVQRVRGTAQGGRNDALNSEAYGLAQLVHCGGVSEVTIRTALADAARACGLEESEIAATLNSAVTAGLGAPRALPDPPPQGRGRPAVREGASTPSTGSAGEGGEPPAPPPDDAGDAGGPRHWRRQLLGEGGKKDCRENVYLHLVNHPKLQGLVAYDEFAHQVLKTRPPPWDSPVGEWTPNDDYFLGLWLAQQERITIKSESTLIAGVAMAAYANRFHPVRQYLDGLPAWDGIPRLRHWLNECLGADDSEYTALVGSWFVMGMVRRIREPGCQHDYMIVLEGLQGRHKSTALRTLAVRSEWFADTPVRLGTADSLLTLAGKWLFEVAELDSFNRAETTAVKGYVTSRVDRVREPYARRFVDRPRSGVLAGSTNQGEYFKDPTGARRFWPVACDDEIDLEKLRAWRDQLFAEAMVRLASEDPEERRCWPTRAEEEKYLVPQQERREIVDPWFDRLALWLDSRANYGESGLEVREVQSFTSFDLLTKGLNVPMDRIDGGRQMATRVGIVMHRLGWEKRRDSEGARVWRYWRPTKKAAAGKEASGGPGADGRGHEDEALHEF
ncbi:MAG: hypothetical protein AMXMBFR78_11330 [Rubrivivax sp.]